jgi:beta-lactamase regulating signal transducer with metallopeptidase domain/HEAT repeat protein
MTLPLTDAVPASALPTLLLLVKITCVLLAALAVSVALGRASAGSRHLVWLVALAGLLVVPAVAAWAPLPLRVLPSVAIADPASGAGQVPPASAVPSVESAAPNVHAPVPADGAAAGAAGAAGAPTPAAPLWLGLGIGEALAALWLVVALALAVRLAYGAWSVRRIVRRAKPLDDPAWQTPLYEIADRLGLDAAPRLLRSEDVKMPFAAGLLASTIVLPAESDDWSAERRSAVLIHELGHVRRRDLIGHTVGRIACALYWFHPLVWTAARRLRAESERACDDLALVFGARPSDYAEHLLDIVTCVRDHYTPAVALAMAHRKEFEGRMLAILNPELRRRGPSRIETAALVSGLAALALVVGAAAPVPRAAAAAGRAAAANDYLLHAPEPTSPAVFGDTAEPAPGVTHSRIARSTDMVRHTAKDARTVTEQQSRTLAQTDGGAHAVVEPHGAAKPERAADPRAAAAIRIATASDSSEQPDQRAAVLAKTLRSDPSAPVRRIAAWGLHRYAEMDVAADALVAALGGDADASVREMSAWSLAEARRRPAVAAALVKAVRQDRDPEVRSTSVWALGEVRDESAVEALTSALGDSSADTRELAAWAIGSCGPKQAPAALVRALGDRSPDVRLSTAWALYTIRDPATIGAIEAAYHKETDADVRTGLIKALGAMGDGSIDALQRLVTSPDSAVRAVAVTALAGGEATSPWPWPRPQPRPFP